MSQTVTAAMVESWRLHRDVCITNGVLQSTLQHRAPQGAVTPEGGTGGASRNKRYKAPQDTQTDTILNTYQVWAVWKTKEMKGTSADAGDSNAALAWIDRAFIQFPSIDDTGAVIAVQDEDWLTGPDGTLYRMENPMQSEDGGFWSCDMVSQR